MQACFKISGRLQPGFDQSGKQGGADRQDCIVDNETGIMGRHGAGMTEGEERTGRMFQEVGEILAAHEAAGLGGNALVSENFARHPGHNLHRRVVVGQNREYVANIHLGGEPISGGNVIGNRADSALMVSRTLSEKARTVPAIEAVSGMTL